MPDIFGCWKGSNHDRITSQAQRPRSGERIVGLPVVCGEGKSRLDPVERVKQKTSWLASQVQMTRSNRQLGYMALCP